MANLNEEERQQIVRDLALALVDYMGVKHPPVWVENLLKDPPALYRYQFQLAGILHKILDAIFTRTQVEGGILLVPSELPLAERRFVLAQELLSAVLDGLQEYAEGLSRLLMPDLGHYAGYFARVLLAPDPMVDAYRRRGQDFEGFAETFLIPSRIASMRWKDRIYLHDVTLEERLRYTYSNS
jgi:Zn-dependent peptidase ImmA (M78 family)